MQAGTQKFNVNFKGCNRQFHWLEVSLVYDKSDKHRKIYVTMQNAQQKI